MDAFFEIAARLMVIWEKVLAHKVGIKDNFFEVGGNSFLALRLGAEVGHSFGRTLPIGVIFYLPTIEQLARYLAGEEELPVSYSLVPLSVTGSGRPIFVVHWMVRDLVRHLGKARPVYGLSFGMASDQDIVFPESVEALAAHYLDELRLAQPAGPYTLIGYSAGGIIAYEMAQQLRAAGERVDFLGLIDTYRPKDFFARGERLPLHEQALNLVKLGPREIYRSLEHWYFEPLYRKLHPRQQLASERSLTYSDFMVSTSEFWMNYTPQPYPGKVTFFKSTGLLSVRNRAVPPEQFWLALGEVELHPVPGRHLSSAYYTPHARVLAAEIERCLAVPDEGADHKEPMFRPDAVSVTLSQLTAFMHYCAAASGRVFDDYRQFERFAVDEFRQFWRLFVTWTGLVSHGDYDPVCTSERIEDAEFFPGLRLNYAQNLLSGGHPHDPAITMCYHDGSRQRLSYGDLSRAVAQCAAALVWMGVQRGDRVVAIARNNAEVVIAALASASIGAVFASCPQDMSSFAVLSRFQPLTPKVLFTNVRPQPWDIGAPLPLRVAEVIAGLPSLTAVAVLDDSELAAAGVRVYHFAEIIAREVDYQWKFFGRHPFNHPLFILFSSGTTGPPKCIVHGTGGTLIEHLKEHRLHCDLKPGDKLFYQTSAGWMMWNWQLSALASGVELVLYDGPLGGPETLWRVVAEEEVTVFGTSAAFLQFCQGAGYAPRQLDLSALRAILSTGSILYPKQYDWVKEQVKELPLQSISGGTDIVGCFVLGNPNLPVYRGQSQCRSLGLDVRALLPEGVILNHIGGLVCANPFPSRPIGFYGDDGSRFHDAYFSQHPFMWTHGDLIEFTREGGAILHGRSDGVLNIRGIRIGPAEIYRILQEVPEIAEAMALEQEIPLELGGAQLVLLVVLRPGAEFTPVLDTRLRFELFTKGSAAHVPARILAVKELPVTHSGKRSEAAAGDALNHRPVRNQDALANPEVLAALY